MRGAGARTTALLEGKVDLVVLSRFAADRLIEEHPVELVADLGPATYVGAHGLLLRHGTTPGTPGLRVAVDHASEDQRMLAERAFAGRADIKWVEASYMQLRELFEHDLADATVWNLDEVQGLPVRAWTSCRSATRSPAIWPCATPGRRSSAGPRGRRPWVPYGTHSTCLSSPHSSPRY